MAAVLDLTGFAKRHETVAGAAFPVAGSTEAWDVSHFHQPLDNIIERSCITEVKLCRVFFFRFRLCISAYTCLGAATDLGDSKVQNTLAGFLTLAGRYDHAGIRHCNADACHKFCKNIIVDPVVKIICVNIVGWT